MKINSDNWAKSLSKRASRRDFLYLSSWLAGTMALGTLPAQAASTATRPSRIAGNPFTLGVASGDPLPDSVILWTRLDREALASAATANQLIEVDYELSDSDSFANIIRSETAIAVPQLGYSVHADVKGLRPGRDYYFRWHLAGETSPVGRTRTAPAIDAEVDQFRFAFASCQQYEHGHFTAYQHMAEENFDLIVHLGDYIYERSWGENLVRAHEGPEIQTLDDYRARYTTYKSDPDLQAAHASAPWAVTWDDHEVDNNYANLVPEDEQIVSTFLRRRAAAYQAYYEFMPVRLPSGRFGPDMQIYRPLRFGKLMEMSILDTRQYRHDQACGDGRKTSCAEHQDPSRSALGAVQRNWLLNRLQNADSRWNVLAQQIMMAPLTRYNEFGEVELPMDLWDGYPYERQKLLDVFASRDDLNPIVLTGDIHSNWVTNINSNFSNEQARTVATEFVGTSITSGGDGSPNAGTTNPAMSDNKHIAYYNNQRGYVACNVSNDLWTTDFKVLPFVSQPGADISTAARFVVEAGNPGAQIA